MTSAVVSQPTKIVEAAPKPEWPSQLMVRVSRYIITRSDASRGDHHDCVVAQAAYFAFRRKFGPNIQTSVTYNLESQEVSIHVVCPDERMDEALYVLPDKAKDIDGWDKGMPLAPFDATIYFHHTVER